MEVDGLVALGSSGGTKPVPIASVAKVMTAHLILRDHPMRTGPGRRDADRSAMRRPPPTRGNLPRASRWCRSYAGETLSERQALEALLLPSANNVAHILARWDAGGDEATSWRR